MKNIIRIIVWTLIALVMQNGIFAYFEYFYLGGDVVINATKVEDNKKDVDEDNTDGISIKSGVKDINVSMDGRYAAYIDEGTLKVFDSYKNKELMFDCDTKGDIECYKWLNDENIILVIQKVIEDGATYFEPVSYDVNKNEARELADFHYNKMRIQTENENDKIENISFSTSTHSLYIKVRKANGLCDLYYSNVMNVVNKVRRNKEIGNIVVPVTNTNAVFEMDNNVTVLNSPDNIVIDGVENAKLLGSDYDDNVYIGSEENGKITAIYYKNLDDTESDWSAYYLDKPVAKNNISISYAGKVYIVNTSTKSVNELSENNVFDYEGKYLQTYKDGFITILDDKLIKNNVSSEN